MATFSTSDLRISGAIMHHPARSHLVSRLLEGCLPFSPRVITDPDPDGVPSPLRTAKLAWAAIADGATHHLVLQDDVVTIPGFARHLRHAVSGRPAAAIAFAVHWRSPQNAYYVRRGAAAGLAWAPLSAVEWTPTLGLLLPVAQARALAAYLSGLPDELLHDDDLIAPYLAARGITVLAAIPHLVEHGDNPSLAGFDHEGARHAAVFDAGWDPGPSHWRRSASSDCLLASLTPRQEPADYTVELADSRCLIRLLRPGTAEPLEHPFGWYWHDWCDLAGADPDDILAGFEHQRRPAEAAAGHGIPLRCEREIWAAGYLLGADLGRWSAAGPPDDGLAGQILRRAVRSWIESGLAPDDRGAIKPHAGYRQLTELCILGLRSGLAARSGQRRSRPAVHANAR